MRVTLSREAESDLEGIGDHIGLDDPDRAASFILELRDAAMGLAEFPRRFPVLRNRSGGQIRKRSYGRYVILYEASADGVRILRVLHSARRFSVLLR